MFTGLIQDTARVVDVREAGEGKRVILESDILQKLEKGDSVSISGACLTVEDSEKGQFFLAEETMDRTWFDSIQEDDILNMELPLRPEDRMGGHYVQGHIEETVELMEIEELEEGWNLWFSKPETDFLVKKGFVSLEGISLTVAEMDDDRFSATIIPETWDQTNLSDKEEGDRLNFEADVMARYAQSVTD